MRRFAALAVLLILSVSAWGADPNFVAHLKDFSNQPATAYVRVTLQNCGAGNIPRVASSKTLAVSSMNFSPDASGDISIAITPNSDIACGVMTGQTYYSVEVWSSTPASYSKTRVFAGNYRVCALGDAGTCSNTPGGDFTLNSATPLNPTPTAPPASTSLDTDTTLAANSDTRVASQKATKAYVDAHAGSGDATSYKGNSAPTAAEFGRVSGVTSAIQTQIDGKEPANANIQAHIASTSNPHSVTKTQVGLGNADNTSDANKPVSTATQAALDAKVPTSRLVNGHALSADVTVTKTDVGLGSVTNDAQVKAADVIGAGAKVPSVDAGIADGCAQVATGKITSTGSPCGAGGGSPPTGTGWVHVTGGVQDGAASTPTKSDVGLGSVTNDVQAKAADVSTTAGAGKIPKTGAGSTLDPGWIPAHKLEDASNMSTTGAVLDDVVCFTQVTPSFLFGPCALAIGVHDHSDSTHGGNIPESSVTSLTTDLAAKVPTSRTVNGHALSADVTVTKSDVGLGSVTNDAQLKAADAFGSAPGTKVATTSLGADPTTDNCVKWIAGGKLGDAGAACGSGGTDKVAFTSGQISATSGVALPASGLTRYVNNFINMTNDDAGCAPGRCAAFIAPKTGTLGPTYLSLYVTTFETVSGSVDWFIYDISASAVLFHFTSDTMIVGSTSCPVSAGCIFSYAGGATVTAGHAYGIGVTSPTWGGTVPAVRTISVTGVIN